VFREQRADLMFIVMRAYAPWLKSLFESVPLKFVEVKELAALTRQFSFLTVIKRPQGAIDLVKNFPGRDVRLLATSTSLLTTPSVPSATKMLVLQALKEIDHGSVSRLRTYRLATSVDRPLQRRPLGTHRINRHPKSKQSTAYYIGHTEC
jgi:hypothetical protein